MKYPLVNGSQINMITGQDNKNSYFALSVDIPPQVPLTNKEEVINNIDADIDMVLSGIQATLDIARFEKVNQSKLVYFFKTKQRKRRGQLLRLTEKFIQTDKFEVKMDPLTKSNFYSGIKNFQENKNFRGVIDPVITNTYRGNDIQLFNNRQNWYPWQNDVYSKIFHKGGAFREPDKRKIIFLLDEEGNCGKSSFFKWMYFNYPQNIGRITYGTTGQLRSSIANIGNKKLYIIDLPRAKGKNDNSEELLSIIEELKNRIVTNTFRDDGRTLMMEPPHIIVSGNYVLDQGLLSEGRWKSYKIEKPTKTLKNITKSLQRKYKLEKD